MQARVAAHRETRRATDGPLRFDHDGIPGTIREEPDLIAVLKAQRLEVVHGQIQVVGSAAARSAEADVRGPRLRIGKLDELRAGQFAGLNSKRAVLRTSPEVMTEGPFSPTTTVSPS